MKKFKGKVIVYKKKEIVATISGDLTVVTDNKELKEVITELLKAKNTSFSENNGEEEKVISVPITGVEQLYAHLKFGLFKLGYTTLFKAGI